MESETLQYHGGGKRQIIIPRILWFLYFWHIWPFNSLYGPFGCFIFVTVLHLLQKNKNSKTTIMVHSLFVADTNDNNVTVTRVTMDPSDFAKANEIAVLPGKSNRSARKNGFFKSKCNLEFKYKGYLIFPQLAKLWVHC